MKASERIENDDAPSSVQQLVGDIAVLVRQELELAKKELTEKAKSAGIGAGMISASALGAMFTLACLTALVIVALNFVVPLWAALLVALALWAGTTAALALYGKRKVQNASPFVPEQTIEDIKEDVAWARRGGKQLRT